MKGTLSFLGTGIRPYYMACSSSTFMECTCPKCKTTDQRIPLLTRDYISILGMPVFPLGVSAVGRCCGLFRISMSRNDKQELVWRCNAFINYKQNLGRKGAWWVACSVALLGLAVGVVLGQLVAAYFAAEGIRQIAIIIAVTLLAMIIANAIYRGVAFKGSEYIMRA